MNMSSQDRGYYDPPESLNGESQLDGDFPANEHSPHASGMDSRSWLRRFSSGLGVGYPKESEAVLQKLARHGVNADLLLSQWGVVLWSVKVKGPEIKLKLQAFRHVNEVELAQWLQELLGAERSVKLKFKPLSSCCQSRCEGCLYGNPGKRIEWIDSALADEFSG